MKRLALSLALAASLAAPATVLGFHHTGIPARFCTPDAAGSPSNDNGQAKENLLRIGKHLPLPPAGPAGASGHTPQAGEIGAGADSCANG